MISLMALILYSTPAMWPAGKPSEACAGNMPAACAVMLAATVTAERRSAAAAAWRLGVPNCPAVRASVLPGARQRLGGLIRCAGVVLVGCAKAASFHF